MDLSEHQAVLFNAFAASLRPTDTPPELMVTAKCDAEEVLATAVCKAGKFACCLSCEFISEAGPRICHVANGLREIIGLEPVV